MQIQIRQAISSGSTLFAILFLILDWNPYLDQWTSLNVTVGEPTWETRGWKNSRNTGYHRTDWGIAIALIKLCIITCWSGSLLFAYAWKAPFLMVKFFYIVWFLMLSILELIHNVLYCVISDVNWSFYAPNFEEVEWAYWFRPVHPSVHLPVHLSICYTS